MSHAKHHVCHAHTSHGGNDVYDICAIVPSLNPDDKLIAVVDSLSKLSLRAIIVVDDGSREDCKKYFDEVHKRYGCPVLVHCKNMGKGRALKTAFNYYLNTYPDSLGVVTVDADNQHRAEDVLSCCQALKSNESKLILGVRDFSLPNVPPRSRKGNKITCGVFRLLCGINVSDTQTGLRALPRSVVYDLVDLPGERYEYETNMLIETKKRHISIEEVSIQTVYIDDNSSSHFNPLKDSLRIYALILKFLSASLSSCLIDMALFILMVFLLRWQDLKLRLLISTITARVLSSLFNYSVNKNIVFANQSNIRSTILRYYILCAVQMIMSFAGVYVLKNTFTYVSEIIFKIAVDFILFLISFQIQREWVFKDAEKQAD